MEKTNISSDAITPYIRKAGIQGPVNWKGHTRRIYDHQWMFVTAGRGYYKDKDVQCDLLPGTLLLIEPGIEHSFWLDEKLPAVIKWIHFDVEYRKDVYDLDAMLVGGQGHLFDDDQIDEQFLRKSYVFEGSIELPRTMEITEIDEMEGLFDAVIDADKEHKFTWQLCAKAKWMEVLERVMDQLVLDKKVSTSSDTSDLITNICHYISNNYHNKLTRGNLANYYGYNADYFGKLFKDEMKKSISAYINEVRIEKAKSLLVHTNLSIQNISELVGYSDVFYFSKKMKAATGHPPSKWR